MLNFSQILKYFWTNLELKNVLGYQNFHPKNKHSLNRSSNFSEFCMRRVGMLMCPLFLFPLQFALLKIPTKNKCIESKTHDVARKQCLELKKNPAH